jgi:hypothetical protein
MALGIVIPLVCYPVLRRLVALSIDDAASIAAYYGSASAGTFAVVWAMVEQAGIRLNPETTGSSAVQRPGPGGAVGKRLLYRGLFQQDRPERRNRPARVVQRRRQCAERDLTVLEPTAEMWDGDAQPTYVNLSGTTKSPPVPLRRARATGEYPIRFRSEETVEVAGRALLALG